MNEHTATIIYIRSLVPVVEAAGMPRARFLERLAIDEELLLNIDARVPKDVVAQAWDIAAATTKHEHFGLVASLHAPPGTFPVLDHVAANMPTVGDALRAIARYCRLCDDELCMSFDLTPAGAVVGLALLGKDVRYSRHWAEWFVGLIVSRARSLAGAGEISPVEVTFQHSAPSSDATLRSMLGCPPAFGRPRTSVAFPAQVLALRIRDASPFLSGIVTRHAEADLQRHGSGDQFATSVRRILLQVLEQEAPRISAVARSARCSVRTVQDRLKREGTSYEEVLDLVRRDMTLRYVEDDAIRLIELPLLLKFADASSFYRAFRRWTGTTPLEHRRQLVSRRASGAPAPLAGDAPASWAAPRSQ